MAEVGINQVVFLGTELKLNVHIDPIDEITMRDYRFVLDLYCSSGKVLTITKSEAMPVDNNNYIVLVDTNLVGAGQLKCKVTAELPDADFDDKLRTEVSIVDTGINIVKKL